MFTQLSASNASATTATHRTDPVVVDLPPTEPIDLTEILRNSSLR
jgi:hypothetical protein